MLLEAAEEAEIPTEGLQAWLQGDEGSWEIQRKYAEIFYGWGYTSVPVTMVSCEGLKICGVMMSYALPRCGSTHPRLPEP